ncbi:50S ribosomal protein L32 [Candidatus Gracilibacteria bacterium]|jgi:hypothetical protein|nr:50S ribosomal protein L32 [Candidatus Gracilibacteria bacterium]
MAVPKKKTSKTRTNRRYRTWVMKEQRRLSENLVLVPYGRGGELKPAHTYIDDGEDLRRRKADPKTPATEKAPKAKSPAKKAAKPAETSPSETSGNQDA